MSGRRPLAALLALGLGWCLAGGPPEALAQKAPVPGPLGRVAPKDRDEDQPLRIVADRLEAEQDKRLVIFTGKVKAQRGEAVLYCDQLFVYYKTVSSGQTAPGDTGEAKPQDVLGGLGGGERLDRIEAKGQVRYVQEDKVATGDTAIYYQDTGEIHLLGHPQVWQGENHLKGDRIIFNTRENRVLVESSAKQRVEAYLYQGSPGPGSPGAPGPAGKPRPPRQESPPPPRRP